MNCRNGDISALNVEAIVNSTNESLNDKSPMSERIVSRGGSELKRELKTNIKGLSVTFQEIFNKQIFRKINSRQESITFIVRYYGLLFTIDVVFGISNVR